jgi:4-carboxymuconolactone decarboxylase
MIGRPVLEPRTRAPGRGASAPLGTCTRTCASKSEAIRLLLRKPKHNLKGTAMTDATEPRIAPLEPPYDPDTEASLRKWMPPGSDIEPLRLFRTLMRHEQLAGRMRPLGAGILGPSATVPPPLREVMIHRTCALTGAEYEWGVHATAFGRPLGLSDEQLRSTVAGASTDACWDPEQSLVFELADQLHHTSTVTDQLWRELAAAFGTEQLIELLVTAGWYHVIGYVCNAAAIGTEQWGERFPA